MDENAGRISGGGVAAHHDVGIAALLEVRIKDRFAGRAPARLPLKHEITVADLEAAERAAGVAIRPGNTVLIHMAHHARTWGTEAYLHDFPGVSVAAARWLGSKGIVSFGVEAVSPGTEGKSNFRVHLVCREMGFTHMEGLVNLERLVGAGRFRFCGFPLKIKGGTASPIRAVAILDDD